MAQPGESINDYIARLERENLESGRIIAEYERRNVESDRTIADYDRRIAEYEWHNGDLMLPDYLHESHEHLQNSIRVHTITTETTQGDLTDPTGKLCPARIEEWKDFGLTQKALWDRLGAPESTFGSNRCYDNRDFIRRLSGYIRGHPITSEDDVAFVARLALETPVAKILENMHADSQVADAFNLKGDKLWFENHGNAVTEDDLDARMGKMAVQTPAGQEGSGETRSFGREFDSSVNRAYMHADQICLYRKDGRNELALIVEYKAPHKLTLEIIHDGLHPMDPFGDVIHRVDKKDEKAKAAFKVAAAITQTYDYMVRSRLAYGYLFTGEALVFLHIGEYDATTVRYHLSVPQRALHNGTLWSPDVPDQGNLLHQTALAQVAIFCLQALQQKRYQQDWLQETQKQLKVWKQDDVEILRQLPVTPKSEAEASSLFIPTDTPGSEIVASPRILRRQTRAMKKAEEKAVQDAQDALSLTTNWKDDDEDDNNGDDLGLMKKEHGASSGHRQNRAPNSPTPAPKSSRSGSHDRGGRGNSKRSNSEEHERDYCTQACILGLIQSSLLDPHCPNNDAHRLHNLEHHVLNRPAFLRYIQAQMAHDLDIHVHDLRLKGSRGALFKVTLASHGYTVMGKGTTYPWITDLKHEEAIYKHVHSLQGRSIPVCIGSIDLEWHYQYSAFEELEFMMFMAYGGMPLHKCEHDGVWVTKSEKTPIGEVTSQATQVMAELHQSGVAQRDVALRNLLWDERAKRVLCIDFERSVLFGPDDSVNSKLKEEAKVDAKDDAAAAAAAAAAASCETVKDSQHHVESEKENIPPAVAADAPLAQEPSTASPARQPLGEILPNASPKRVDRKQVHFSLPPPPASGLQPSGKAASSTAKMNLTGRPAKLGMQRHWKVILRNQYDDSWLSSWEGEKANEAKQLQAELNRWVTGIDKGVW